jgi:hypothetical protein
MPCKAIRSLKPSTISPYARVNGSSSSRSFQTIATRPPERSTRANSAIVAALANQWKDWNEVIRSTLAAGTPRSSACASRIDRPADSAARAHLGVGLEARDPRAARGQQLGRDARARTDVEHGEV